MMDTVHIAEILVGPSFTAFTCFDQSSFNVFTIQHLQPYCAWNTKHVFYIIILFASYLYLNFQKGSRLGREWGLMSDTLKLAIHRVGQRNLFVMSSTKGNAE